MLKGTIDILILSVLSQGDNYGYEISRIIKARTEGMFEILEATMYLALKRLETAFRMRHMQEGVSNPLFNYQL